MEFPTVINWTSPFPILGKLGGIFQFYSNLKRNLCKQTVENLVTCVCSGVTLFADVPQKGLWAYMGLKKARRPDFMHKLGSIIHVSAAATYEPRHEISNNLVCATSKSSDQPAHTRGLIRAFASRLNII